MQLPSYVVVVALLCSLLFVAGVTADIGDVNNLLYNTLKASDSTITAVTTATISSGGTVQWNSAFTTGVGNRALTTTMTTDRCFHMNTMGELFVVLAALQLQQDFAFATTLDDTLNTAYTPSNLTFTNPKNGYNISYKQLMQHTSSILDTSFATFATTSSSTVTSLSTFLSSYFVTVTSGVPALNSAVFSSSQPGLATSYSFARANTALLSFILENVIADKNVGFTSLADYITATFLAPMGMSSTFFLTNASYPGLTTIPSFTGTYPSMATSNNTVSAAYYSGCVIDQMSTVTTLHPAIFADYMGFTTGGDLVRMVKGLFFSTTFSTIVSLMRDIVSISTSVARFSGQSGQGLGLQYFNGDTVCASAKGTSVVSTCTVSNATTIYGYLSNRAYMENGFLCTNTGSTTYGLVCVVTSILHTSSSTRGPANVMAMAAVTYQDLVGNVTVTGVPAATPVPAQVQSDWFGVYCFLGVYLTLLGTYFGTLALQWLFQPAALAMAADSSGAASLGYAARNSPPRDTSMMAD
ncbi:beta lactamase-like protein, putative [Bodo saltans]|uniref:Beta lactamase-like protein, putative n=1 Tax=Bodo saltans TaxID=75058 RepID=A0A0S4IPS4_BODSA|nr:beta lactamase-like protein, putative [Bodo saltans]|eukprot:CUF13614.1 beta lactamase-like protein, putative [Bodo saltans]